MWNLIDGNKIISTHNKVQSYRKHLKNLKKVRSQLYITQPFRPTFSLSKRKNKYHKCLQQQTENQNAALLHHMIQLEAEPMKNTCINIPLTIPSNKKTYLALKSRERKHTNIQRDKQNFKILSKIERAQSPYGKRIWQENWKQVLKYKSNITKKQFIPDYKLLSKEEDKLQKSRMRPKTAIQ